MAGIRKRDTRWFFSSGVFFGLVLLSRPEYLLFVIVFAGFLLGIGKKDIKDAMRFTAVYIFGVMLIVLPWSTRNYLVFKKPVLIATGGIGESLYGGTYIDMRHWKGWSRMPEGVPYIDEQDRSGNIALHRVYTKTLESGTIDEVLALDREYVRLSLRRIAAGPGQIIKLWIFKIPRLWYQQYIPMYRDPEPSGIFMIVYCAAALCAYVIGHRDRRLAVMAPVGLLCAYLTIVFFPLHVEPRYSVPLLPALISLSGIGIVGLARFLARPRRSSFFS
jgi:hypothetical protein